MGGWSEGFNDFVGFIAILILAGMFWGSFKASMNKDTTPDNASQQNVQQVPTQQAYYRPEVIQESGPSPIISSQYQKGY